MKRYTLRDHANDLRELWRDSKVLTVVWLVLVLGWLWIPFAFWMYECAS